MFPVADGRIKFVGGDQELRTSTLIRDHPIRGESQRNFLGESEGSPPPLPHYSLPDACEAINDFLVHVEPRVKTLRAERRVIHNSTAIQLIGCFLVVCLFLWLVVWLVLFGWLID